MSLRTLFLSGDVMTGRGIDQILSHPGDPTIHEPSTGTALDYVRIAEELNGPIPRNVEPAYIWGDALDVLDEARPEARIVNLETAVTDSEDPWPNKGINYRMHPDNVGCLTSADIDCCVLANNHVLDWSFRGLDQTLATLSKAGIAVAGAGADISAAARPALIETRSRARVVVIALGASSSGIPRNWQARRDRPGVAYVDRVADAGVDQVAATVSDVAQEDDLVVLSIHWGANWGYHIPPSHRRFAQALTDRAGVHMVHGHSSHHPLGIEVHRGRPILYGCGDLINDYEGIRGHEDYRPDLGILYLATFDAATRQLRNLQLVPMRMERFRLGTATGNDREWISRTLTREGRQFGTRVEADPHGHLALRW